MPSRTDSSQDYPDLERDRLLNTLLEKALDLPADRREAFLVESCPDPELRQEVVELLDEDLGDFLEMPAAGPLAPETDVDSPLMMVPLCYFAGLAMRRGELAAARELLEKAEASQGPDVEPTLAHVMLHRNLGKVYEALRITDRAADQYQRAIRILEALPHAPGRRREIRQARADLFQLQGLLQSTSSARSVHDLLT